VDVAKVEILAEKYLCLGTARNRCTHNTSNRRSPSRQSSSYLILRIDPAIRAALATRANPYGCTLAVLHDLCPCLKHGQSTASGTTPLPVPYKTCQLAYSAGRRVRPTRKRRESPNGSSLRKFPDVGSLVPFEAKSRGTDRSTLRRSDYRCVVIVLRWQFEPAPASLSKNGIEII